MKLKVGKFYKTRNGSKCVIYALDGFGKFPVNGAIYYKIQANFQKGWFPTTWTIDGNYTLSEVKCDEDIIEEWKET